MASQQVEDDATEDEYFEQELLDFLQIINQVHKLAIDEKNLSL